MYTLKVSYGDVDEPETATVEVLGTYKTQDEAANAARSEFDAILERIDDTGARFDAVEISPYRYYVSYGYIEYYYEVSVIERDGGE